MIQHFFRIPAGGRFKHVYYGTQNTDVPTDDYTTNQLFEDGRTVNIDEFVFDDVMDPNPHEVNAVVGAILKLFVQSGGDKGVLPGIDTYNKRLNKAYVDAQGLGLPPDKYNDLLCDENLNFDYFRDKLFKMFKVGGFFLLICDCNSANERRTMRIRLSMLVTREAAYQEPPHTPAAEDLDEQVDTRRQSRLSDRYMADYGYKSTLPNYIVRPHGVRWLLEAICVYKLPTIRNHTVAPHTLGNFEYFDAAVGQIRTVLSGPGALQFLDVFAHVNGIPEIRLESVFRSLVHPFDFDFVYGPPNPNDNTYNVGDWIVRFLPATTMPDRYQYGVITDTDATHSTITVRFWSEVVEKKGMRVNKQGRKHDFETQTIVSLKIVSIENPLTANLEPGMQVSYIREGRLGWSRALEITDRDELHCELSDGTNVDCHIRKLYGARTNASGLAYLHEFYYRMGYDFEESNILYALCTLRKCMEYSSDSWYDPEPNPARRTRANLGPDDTNARMQVILGRQYERQPLLPDDGHGPNAYVHPIENVPGRRRNGTRTDTLISMIRRVTGLYNVPGPGGLQVAGGNPANVPRLIGRDGRPQQSGRRMQSITLQDIATEQKDPRNPQAERWQFTFGALDNQELVQAAQLGPSTLVLVQQARLAVEGGATAASLRDDLNAVYQLLVTRQTLAQQSLGAQRNTLTTQLKTTLQDRERAAVLEAQERAARITEEALRQRLTAERNERKRKTEGEEEDFRKRLLREEEEESKSDVVLPSSYTTRHNVTENVSSTLGFEGASARQIDHLNATATEPPKKSAGRGGGRREQALVPFDIRTDGLTRERAEHPTDPPELTVSAIEGILQKPLNMKLRTVILDALTGVNPLPNDMNEFIRLAKDHLKVINGMVRMLPVRYPVSKAFPILQNIQFLASQLAASQIGNREDFIRMMRTILIAIETMDDPEQDALERPPPIVPSSSTGAAPTRPRPLMYHETATYRHQLQEMTGAARAATGGGALPGEGRGYRNRLRVNYFDDEEESKEDAVRPPSTSSSHRRPIQGPPRKSIRPDEHEDDDDKDE
jgi:hypothetical protein